MCMKVYESTHRKVYESQNWSKLKTDNVLESCKYTCFIVVKFYS